jgi:stearoyl-CoA desaturase (delta-9 desaturase)
MTTLQTPAGHAPGGEITDDRVPMKIRVVNFLGVFLPLAGVLAAFVLLWGIAFSWVHLMILGIMYAISGFGITVGYHRYFTHRSFQTSRFMQTVLGVCGSMAVEGPIVQWVATHRQHHQHSDSEHDPHSPHTHGDTVMGALRGAWHAHVGWILEARTFSKGESGVDVNRYAKDLIDDPVTKWVSDRFGWWVALGLVIPTVLGGVLTMSWTGAVLGLIWGGLVRVFLVHHVTWSVNSVCHIWGSRPFKSHDHSRNNAIFGVLALGEGWHNNHHAFPTSARHGLKWWQLDLSYIVIVAMKKLGLARDLRVPSAERQAAKLRGG